MTVTDVTNGQSYFDLPVRYADLPRNQGIYEVVPLAAPDKLVIVTSLREYRQYKNTAAGNFEGQLVAYPIASRMFFNRDKVQQYYGHMMLRLVVRDSSTIATDAPYPIPADKEEMVLKACVQWFRDRLAQGSDLVADDQVKLQ